MGCPRLSAVRPPRFDNLILRGSFNFFFVLFYFSCATIVGRFFFHSQTRRSIVRSIFFIHTWSFERRYYRKGVGAATGEFFFFFFKCIWRRNTGCSSSSVVQRGSIIEIIDCGKAADTVRVVWLNRPLPTSTFRFFVLSSFFYYLFSELALQFIIPLASSSLLFAFIFLFFPSSFERAVARALVVECTATDEIENRSIVAEKEI